MRAPRSRLLVLEGLDGTGKTTLARALAAALPAQSLRTPPESLGSVRAAVDRVLSADPLATQLFYAASVAYASSSAQAHLVRGDHVVVDRYWASTVVYAQCREEHLGLEEVAARILPADLTIFLDLDEGLRRERLQARGLTDADRNFLPHHLRLRRLFDRALQQPWSGRVLRLDTGRLRTEQCVDAVRAALLLLPAEQSA